MLTTVALDRVGLTIVSYIMAAKSTLLILFIDQISGTVATYDFPACATVLYVVSLGGFGEQRSQLYPSLVLRQSAQPHSRFKASNGWK